MSVYLIEWMSTACKHNVSVYVNRMIALSHSCLAIAVFASVNCVALAQSALYGSFTRRKNKYAALLINCILILILVWLMTLLVQHYSWWNVLKRAAASSESVDVQGFKHEQLNKLINFLANIHAVVLGCVLFPSWKPERGTKSPADRSVDCCWIERECWEVKRKTWKCIATRQHKD